MCDHEGGHLVSHMWLSPDCTSNPFLSRVTAKGGCEREKGVWETAYTQLGLGITFKVCASIGPVKINRFTARCKMLPWSSQ